MIGGFRVIEYSFENKFPLWHTHKGRVLKSKQLLINDEVVQAYPDNDGRLWYRDKDGSVVIVRD